MDHTQHLSIRQFAWIITTVLISGNLIITPSKTAYLAGIDAWFSYYMPILYALIVAWFFYYLMRCYPGKNLFQIILQVTGEWIGSLLILIFAFYAWMVLMRDIRMLAIFFQNAVLPNTPEEALILTMVLIVIYYGRTSVEIAARVNDMILPLFVIMIFCFPLMLTNEIRLNRIEPFFLAGTDSLLSASILNIGWYGEIFFMGAFLHTVTQAALTKSAMRHGILLTTLILTILSLLSLTVLGNQLTAHSVYPNYSLIQQIHVTDFLDRLDIVVFSMWLPTAMMKNIFVYLAALMALQHLFSSKSRYDYRIINPSFGLFLFLTTYVGFKGLVDVSNMSTHGTISIVAMVQPLMMMIVLIASRFKPGKDGNRRKHSKHKSIWPRMTNSLLVTCLLCIVIGTITALKIPKLAAICALIYACCIVGTTITSSKEMKLGESNQNQT